MVEEAGRGDARAAADALTLFISLSLALSLSFALSLQPARLIPERSFLEPEP